jgi:hypothetical protein
MGTVASEVTEQCVVIPINVPNFHLGSQLSQTIG